MAVVAHASGAPLGDPRVLFFCFCLTFLELFLLLAGYLCCCYWCLWRADGLRCIGCNTGWCIWFCTPRVGEGAGVSCSAALARCLLHSGTDMLTGELTQEQKDSFTWPEWRLCSNFLHRELARLWYGRKSIFNLVEGDAENADFWKLFAAIWGMTIQRFGIAHGLTVEEMAKLSKSGYKVYDNLIEFGFPYGTYLHQITWVVRWIFGNRLASEFLYDFQITEIIALAACVSGYAAEGKITPYAKIKILRPIEFYEGLPVAPELEKQFYGESSAP